MTTLPTPPICGRMVPISGSPASERNSASGEGRGILFPRRHDSELPNGVADAQSNFRCDLVHSVDSYQRCECSGNSPWCSGGRCGRRSGGRPSRCRRGRCRGSGYWHGQRNSGSSTGSCSRSEHDHGFWRLTYRANKSWGKEVRGRPTGVGCFSPGFGRGFYLRRLCNDIASPDARVRMGIKSPTNSQLQPRPPTWSGLLFAS